MEEIVKAASNAMTILNMAQISFINAKIGDEVFDFKGIKVPEANLDRAFLDGIDFSGADLSKVSFKNAWLRNANFSTAKLDHANFGQRAHLHVGSWIYGVATGDDNDTVAVASWDNYVKFYKISDGKENESLRLLHDDSVQAVAINPQNGKVVATGCADNMVRIWNLDNPKTPKLLRGHSDKKVANKQGKDN